MEDKYLSSVVAIKLLESTWAYLVALPTPQNLRLKMKEVSGSTTGWQMVSFHFINQSYENKITFGKRQAIAALIILHKKTNENFRIEMDDALAEQIKTKKRR